MLQLGEKLGYPDEADEVNTHDDVCSVLDLCLFAFFEIFEVDEEAGGLLKEFDEKPFLGLVDAWNPFKDDVEDQVHEVDRVDHDARSFPEKEQLKSRIHVSIV